MKDEELQTYLNDHLSGATAGLDLARHLAEENAGTELQVDLGELVAEIETERNVLKDLVQRLGFQESRVKKALGWVGEKAALTKLEQGSANAGAARLLGLEALGVGVYGKRSLWQALETMQSTDARLKQLDFHSLRELSERQLERLETCRLKVAA